jgi:hypothetical protein
MLDSVTLLWALAMLVALVAHALGWRSWLRSFAPLEPRRGSVDLPGSPREVSERIARALATGTASISARVLEAEPGLVRAEIKPILPTRKGRSGTGGTEAARLICHIDERIDGCRVEYSLDASPLGARYRVTTLILLGLGAAAILAAAVLFPTLILPSDNPGVRGQTAQVVQLVHLLWPPFLLTYQARRARSLATEDTLDLMSNLPYR